MKEKLSEIIQSAVGGCAKYWADIIADYLLANGVIVPPYKPLPLVWPEEAFQEQVLCPICETDLMGCYIDGDESPTVVTCYHCGAWIDSTKAVTKEQAEKALVERGEGK